MEIQAHFEKHWESYLVSFIILVSAFLLTRLSRFILNRFIKKQSQELNSDPTNFRFLKHSISVLIFLIATILILYTFPTGRTLAVSLFTSAGIIAAVAAFASQAALSNIVGGVFIVIFKPFRVNDLITVGTQTGYVEDITLRHVIIRDFENRRIIIPNSVISAETVTNSTIEDPKIRRNVDFSISLDSDVRLAKKIMQEEAEKHPLTIDNRTAEQLEAKAPIVDVKVIGFGESDVKLRAYVWANSSADAFTMLTDLNELVIARFNESGIAFPFPTRRVLHQSRDHKADPNDFPGD